VEKKKKKKKALHRSKTQILPFSVSMPLHSFEVVILLTFEGIWGRQRKPLLDVHETTVVMQMWFIFTSSSPIAHLSRQKTKNCPTLFGA